MVTEIVITEPAVACRQLENVYQDCWHHQGEVV